MAFVILLFKANEIDKKKEVFQSEKNTAIKIEKGKLPKYSLKTKFRHHISDKKRAIKKWCSRVFSFPKKSRMHKICVNLRHDGTIENYIWKSMIGFVAGFLLTLLFYMFFVIILSLNFKTATLLCAVIGSIMTVGLAFSPVVRCVVLLVLPQFFSKRGRQTLIAYAFILAITGPTKNTLNNMGILSESLACGQEHLKEAVRQIMDVVKKPFIAIKDAVKKVIVVVKEIIKKIKAIFLTIKRIVMGIVKVIKAAFNFLGKIFNICSKKVGTPFQRCTRAFENSITDCHAKLGPMFSWLCSIAYVTKAVCYIVKPLDFICMLLDFINDSIVGVIVRKIKVFIRHIRSTFYVRVRFSHSFQFETSQSKSLKDVSKSILAEIKMRSKNVAKTFGFLSGITSFFFLVIILRALNYRYKYLTVEHYNNDYITNNFRKIDIRRSQMDKETLLPLKPSESNHYVDIVSLKLTKEEKKNLLYSVVFLFAITVKLSIHIATDYCVFWLLDLIKTHGQYQNSIPAPNIVGLHVKGNGILADLYKSIASAFNPLGAKMDIDTVPCLPDPIPPNHDTNIQIACLMFLCWILAIFEPYGLRCRQRVMAHYYPARASERAVWLYNRILRKRCNFLKFARRQLRRKFTGVQTITKITFKEYLIANCRLLRFLFGHNKETACVLCAEVFRESDDVQPIRCATPGCPGVYCEPCFKDLNNICTICMDPIQYGDLTDMDEEKDSSEDEFSTKFQRRTHLSIKIQRSMGKLTPQEKREKLKHEFHQLPADEDISSNEDYNETTKLLTLEENQSDSTQIISEKGILKQLPEPKYSRLSAGFDYDSDVSTEYSFTYQYRPRDDSFAKPTRKPFVDIEEQHMPDYVTMDIFNIEVPEHLTEKDQCDREEYEYSDCDYSTSSGENQYSDEVEQNLKKYQEKNVLNWLKNSFKFTRTESVTDNEYELKPLRKRKKIVPSLDLRKLHNTTESDYEEKSLLTTSDLTLTTDRSKKSTPKPKSPETDEESEDSKRTKLNHLFHVEYEEINESPRSYDFSSSPYESSRIVSSQHTQNNPSSNTSIISSLDNGVSARNYREKVKQYYKDINRKEVIDDNLKLSKDWKCKWFTKDCFF